MITISIGYLYKKNWIGFLCFSLIIGIVSACSGTKSVPVPRNTINSLPGYAVKDTNFSRKDFNVWVITTQLSFDSIFVNTIQSAPRPNFDEQMVVAIKAQTANNSYKVEFKEMVLLPRALDVFFKVEKERPGDEGAGWVSVSAIPRNREIRRVNFFFDDVLIRSIPVVIVY